MGSQADFTCILGCKYLFVRNLHTLLLGTGAKMDGWLEGHPILTCLHTIDIFSTAVAVQELHALCP